MTLYAFICLSAFLSLASAVNFTDGNVLPTPIDSYDRYLTLYGQGTRTYACDRIPGSTNFTLININNDLYRAVPTLNLTTLVGRRVYLASSDYDNGAFAFYTKEGAFAYWVGRSLDSGTDSSNTGPDDLPAELELVTERSEPKPGQTVLDIGMADFVTRFGAVGGLVPAGTPCNPAEPTISIAGTTFYSFWKRTT